MLSFAEQAPSKAVGARPLGCYATPRAGRRRGALLLSAGLNKTEGFVQAGWARKRSNPIRLARYCSLREQEQPRCLTTPRATVDQAGLRV